MSGYPPPIGFNVNPDQPSGYPPMPGGYPPPYMCAPQSGNPQPPGALYYQDPNAGYGYPPQAGYPPSSSYQFQGQMDYPGAPGSHPGYGSSAPHPAPGASYGSIPGYSGPGGISSYYRGNPTVFPAPNFNPVQDADDLRKAMRKIRNDDATIIRILSKRTASQRVEIAKKYMASFGKDLESHLKSELNGKFKQLVLLSLKTTPDMLGITVNQAIKGAGTNEQLLMQAIIPYSNKIIQEMGAAYEKRFGRDIVKDVRGDTRSDFEKILVAMLQGQRDESACVDMCRAAKDAEVLYEAGEKRLGTEEAVFTRIFAQCSFGHIKAVNEAYLQRYGHDLEKAIKKETSGDYKDALLQILKFSKNKADLLAEWFYDSMKGLGTADWSLMQLTLGRCEIDLQDVKDAYQKKYGVPLAKSIEEDTSGDYKLMYLGLVGN